MVRRGTNSVAVTKVGSRVSVELLPDIRVEKLGDQVEGPIDATCHVVHAGCSGKGDHGEDQSILNEILTVLFFQTVQLDEHARTKEWDVNLHLESPRLH